MWVSQQKGNKSMWSFAKNLLMEHITDLLNELDTVEYKEKKRNLCSFSCVLFLLSWDNFSSRSHTSQAPFGCHHLGYKKISFFLISSFSLSTDLKLFWLFWPGTYSASKTQGQKGRRRLCLATTSSSSSFTTALSPCAALGVRGGAGQKGRRVTVKKTPSTTAVVSCHQMKPNGSSWGTSGDPSAPTSQIPLPKPVPCLASAALAGPLEAVLGPTLSALLSAVSFLGGRQPFGVRPFARSKAWPFFHLVLTLSKMLNTFPCQIRKWVVLSFFTLRSKVMSASCSRVDFPNENQTQPLIPQV